MTRHTFKVGETVTVVAVEPIKITTVVKITENSVWVDDVPGYMSVSSLGVLFGKDGWPKYTTIRKYQGISDLKACRKNMARLEFVRRGASNG